MISLGIRRHNRQKNFYLQFHEDVTRPNPDVSFQSRLCRLCAVAINKESMRAWTKESGGDAEIHIENVSINTFIGILHFDQNTIKDIYTYGRAMTGWDV